MRKTLKVRITHSLVILNSTFIWLYSGESLIELIQPLGGRSIFQDYLEKNPEGGIQHIAYSIPVTDLDIAISELTNKGYPVVTSLNLPVAKVVFFDTYKEIGVVTEVIGLTEAGVEFVQQLRSGAIDRSPNAPPNAKSDDKSNTPVLSN